MASRAVCRLAGRFDGTSPIECKNMASFTVRQGRRYRAIITLGWLERWVGNATIASELAKAGFAEVAVTGSGGTRVAEAVWPGADATSEMPPQVSEVAEV
jgi:hypothetical protein